jgi:hypothetical protein
VTGFLLPSFVDDYILLDLAFSVLTIFYDFGRSINPGFPDFFLLNMFWIYVLDKLGFAVNVVYRALYYFSISLVVVIIEFFGDLLL